jgi:hypothetical protein
MSHPIESYPLTRPVEGKCRLLTYLQSHWFWNYDMSRWTGWQEDRLSPLMPVCDAWNTKNKKKSIVFASLRIIWVPDPFLIDWLIRLQENRK